jgi:hypothetical protein
MNNLIMFLMVFMCGILGIVFSFIIAPTIHLSKAKLVDSESGGLTNDK